MGLPKNTAGSSIQMAASPKRAIHPPSSGHPVKPSNTKKDRRLEMETLNEDMLSSIPEPILARSPPMTPSRNLFGSITKVAEYKEQVQQATTHDVRCSSPKKMVSPIKRFSLLSALTPTKKDRIGVVEATGSGPSGLSSSRHFKSGSRMATPSKNFPEDKGRMSMSPTKNLSTFNTPLELVSSPSKQYNSRKVERIGEAHLLSSPSRQGTTADSVADAKTARPREIPSSKNLSTYVMSPYKKLSLASVSSPSKTGKSALRKENIYSTPIKTDASSSSVPRETEYEYPSFRTPFEQAMDQVGKTSVKGISCFGATKTSTSVKSITSPGPITLHSKPCEPKSSCCGRCGKLVKKHQ